MHYSTTHNIIQVRNESERNELLAQVAKRAERVQLLVYIVITSSRARSARFATYARSSLHSLCHCANIVCCGLAHRCSHQHIHVLHDDKLSHVTKMRVNIIVIAMGTVEPMSKVEGSWTWL